MTPGDGAPGDRRTHYTGYAPANTEKEYDPLERQRAYGGLMRFALVALLLVIDLCPEGMSRGFRRPFYERLSEERRTLEAPVDPGLLAAAFGHRRDAGVFLEFLGRGIAFALFAKGDEEAGGKDSPGAGQGLKQREVGMALGALGDDCIEICNSLQGDAELGHEGLHQEGLGVMMPSSVVRAMALLMAWMRVAMTSAERTWWARKKPSRVARRASCAALRVGQWLRKSQKMPVSFSGNHCKTCGK